MHDLEGPEAMVTSEYTEVNNLIRKRLCSLKISINLALRLLVQGKQSILDWSTSVSSTTPNKHVSSSLHTSKVYV